MATVTRVFFSAENDAVQASFSYDDVSLLITTATLTNNATRGTLTIDLRDATTNALVFGPTSRSFGTGVFSVNVSSMNLLMHSQQFTDKSGNTSTILVPPFIAECGWSLAA